MQVLNNDILTHVASLYTSSIVFIKFYGKFYGEFLQRLSNRNSGTTLDGLVYEYTESVGVKVNILSKLISRFFSFL